MKKQVTPEIICRLNQLMNAVCQHLANEEFEKANSLQEEYYQLEETYDLFDKEFEENGKIGLKEVTGKTLVPPIYKGFSELYSYTIKRGDPIAAANDEGKFALVTTDGYGLPLTSFDYDMIECKHHTSFYSCYKMINGELQCGLLNKYGKEIIPCKMDTIWDIHNNIIIVDKDDKYGLYTTFGLYIPPMYNEIEPDEAGFLLVQKGNEWGYISEQGDFIHEDDEETLDHTTILALYPEW
jgi:hypothetical protein